MSPTLLLSPRFSEDSNALWRAAVAASWEVIRLHRFEVPEELREGGGARRTLAYYGETLLADAISEDLGLTLLEPSYDFLPSLPERFRKRTITLMQLGEARALSTRSFVKPVDEKTFPAKVYDPRSVDSARIFSDADLVLVSEPVTFELEVRAFLREGTVATFSAYLRNGEVARTAEGEWLLTPEEEEAARTFLQDLVGAADFSLPPAVVVDIGKTAEAGWVVVEANACWASGICGCDPYEVLKTVARAAAQPQAGRPTSASTPEDARWSRALHRGA
jgi:hypothetical protein